MNNTPENSQKDTLKSLKIVGLFSLIKNNSLLNLIVALVGGLLLAWLIIHLLGKSNVGSLMSGSDSISAKEGDVCLVQDYPNNSCLGNPNALCEKDMEVAKIAWKFYENNYQPTTGLFNSVDNYTSTTMWDTGSALAATIAANDIGLIEQKEFDDKVMALFKTLKEQKLFNNEAPNKVYNTVTGEMVDYGNNPTPDGIGVSTLDLARLVSWMNTLTCMHPKYKYEAEQIISRWKFDRLIKDGQMFGLLYDPVSKETQVVQEGRLGYEQYAGKVFKHLGFDQHVASTYNNKFARSLDMLGVPIAYDARDPRDLGAYNYVVSESYVMDGMEHGVDAENEPLIRNIFEVQKRRYQEKGIITAISEDNIDRPPYFLYNTIFSSGLPWNTTTDMGVRYDHLKTVSVKAAMSLASFYPDDEYSKVLFNRIESAYDPDRGWYSGVYEAGLGYNTAMTANTNGIILSLFLHKKYGPTYRICDKCERKLELDEKILKANTCDRCVTH
ncbi:MAG: Unknown protein [uncultured Thiotrichaceae bacterium]|uniref:DUF3131 domain-containing protein n=1 Tax=uncultured Thiotrichaceae bacterium TaxID=298394 RepID=A0A6S6TAG8_9GAMM|nr:MAG: Unknown protein [uncultured Thiotrichaceae bacterium]